MSTREERRMARRITKSAAEGCGIRRLAFMVAVNEGDASAIAELQIAIIEDQAEDNPEAVDIERLKEIFEIVLKIIERILEIWRMFA